jgi:hypothetical protein
VTQPRATITVNGGNSANVSFSSGAANQTTNFSVTSTGSWTITDLPSWCTASQGVSAAVTGTGDAQTVILTATEANTEPSARSANITVSAGGFNRTVTINQPSTAPVITGFSPASGAFNTQVTINGSNFSTTASSNIVSFNGVAAIVTSATTTQLQVTVPKNTNCTGKIIITVGGVTGLPSTNIFTYIPTYTVSTFAGVYYSTGTDNGKPGKFNSPRGLTIDANANVLVADTENQRIRQITPDGTVSNFCNGMGVYIEGIAKLGNYVYVSYNHGIKRTSGGSETITFAGSNSYGYIHASTTIARFNSPQGLTAFGSDIYIADYDNNCIRRIPDRAGYQVASTFAGAPPEKPGSGYVDQSGTNARFDSPTDVAADALGNIYVSDWGNHAIRKITPAGAVSTLAGGTYGNVDATGKAAQFLNLSAICVDTKGNIYVSEYDAFNSRIRMITPDGVVTTIVGGTIGYADDVGTSARFNQGIYGLAITGNILYVSDSFNQLIRKILIE